MLLKLFTDIPTKEVEALCRDDIVSAKRRMAFEVTKLVHGAAEAQRAVEASRALFAGGADMSDVPSCDMEKSLLEAGISILDLVVNVGFVASKGEARRLIAQNGLSLNNKRIESAEQMISANDIDDGALLLQKGKKNFLRVKIA